MNYFWVFVLSAFSIVLPAGIAVFRYQRLKRQYLALCILFWVGLVNETVSYILIRQHRNNTVNSNIYTLIESGILLWMFYRLMPPRRMAFIALSIVLSVIWIVDNVIIHPLTHDNNVFRVISSLVVVYLSIDKINGIIFAAPTAFQRSELLLFTSFFVYYAYKTFITIFDIFPTGVSDNFITELWLILSVINLITNILFTLALAWIPKRLEFT